MDLVHFRDSTVADNMFLQKFEVDLRILFISWVVRCSGSDWQSNSIRSLRFYLNPHCLVRLLNCKKESV